MQQRKPLHPRHRGQRDQVSVRAAWEGKAGESKRPQLCFGAQRAAICKREGASGHRLSGPCCATCGRVVLAVHVVEFRDHHVGVALQLQPEGLRPTRASTLQRVQLANNLQVARGCMLGAQRGGQHALAA